MSEKKKAEPQFSELDLENLRSVFTGARVQMVKSKPESREELTQLLQFENYIFSKLNVDNPENTRD